MTDAPTFLRHIADNEQHGSGWRSGDTAPSSKGWYERFYLDGLHVHYFDGNLWRSTPLSAPHWRQVGDYPCWRELSPDTREEARSLSALCADVADKLAREADRIEFHLSAIPKRSYQPARGSCTLLKQKLRQEADRLHHTAKKYALEASQ